MVEKTEAKTTIALNVIQTIVRLTSLATPGVTRMADYAPHPKSPQHEPDGVKIFEKDGQLSIDVYIAISPYENARLVAEELQQRVVREITEMVGMNVVAMNVHVADVDF